MLSFTCSACGKGLKAKEELAGKKVKCSDCGKVVEVPNAVPAGPRGKNAPATRGSEDDEGAAYQLEDESVPDAENPTGVGGRRGATTEPFPKEACSFLRPPQKPGEIGRLGAYRITRVLGMGGMGVVFKGEDTQLQRPVAIKAMLPEISKLEQAKKRFVREAQAAAKLKHPNIVTIYSVHEDGDVPFLAMEFLQGESLDSRISREGALSNSEIIRIGRELAAGLAEAHSKGFVHRDIKPANIWLEGDKGTAKILDFGLARDVSDKANLTQSGAIIGTPAYMAPEQAAGQKCDHRSDLFSLGSVLYCMATGQRPFKGNDPIALLTALAVEDPTPPRLLNPSLSSAISDLIMSLLAKRPGDRQQSAEEVIAALKKSKGKKQAEQNKQVAVFATIGVLVLLVIILALRGGSSEEKKEEPTGPVAARKEDQPKPAPETKQAAETETSVKPKEPEAKVEITKKKAEPEPATFPHPRMNAAQLTKFLEHEDVKYRVAAAALLGEGGRRNIEAATALTAMLTEKDATARKTAATALGEIANETSGALPHLAKVLVDEDREVRVEAMKAIHRIGPKGSAVAKGIGEMLLVADADLQEQGLRALGKTGADAKLAVGGLSKVIEKGDAKLMSMALTQLEQLGADARDAGPVLQKAHAKADPSTRMRIVRLLATWAKDGEAARLVVSELGKGLSLTDKTACMENLKALERMGKAAKPAASAIETMYRRQKDRDVRAQTLKTLGAMGASGADAVAALIHDLQDQKLRFTDKEFYEDVRNTLVKIGVPAAQGLAEMLSDKGASIAARTAALEIIGEIGPSAAVVLPILSSHRETVPEMQKLLKATIEQLRQ